MSGILIALAGCSTTGKHLQFYEGKPLGTNQIALLLVQYNPLDRSAIIRQIDGKSLGKTGVYNNTSEIELLPGNHTFEVAYVDAAGGHSISNLVLSFNGEAGHTYDLHVSPIYESFGKTLKLYLVGGRFSWTAWVIDEQEQTVVAGQPTEEPPRSYKYFPTR